MAAPVLCFSLFQPILRTMDVTTPFAKSLVRGFAMRVLVRAHPCGARTSSPHQCTSTVHLNSSPHLHAFSASSPAHAQKRFSTAHAQEHSSTAHAQERS